MCFSGRFQTWAATLGSAGCETGVESDWSPRDLGEHRRPERHKSSKKHVARLLVRWVLVCGSPSKPISKSHAGIGWYANSDQLLDLGRIKVLRCLAAVTAGNKETHPGIHPAIQKGSNHCTAELLQVVGKVKTEASKRPIPIDPFIAEDLLLWYRTTKCNRPDDYVFATDAARAGKKRGKQPVWLSKVMSYRIQPVAKRLGIAKRIGWHTFRRTYTTLLHANGEDVKVVQELLRHGSARITMDVYAQAMTPAKRRAQGKVVAMLRDTKKKSS